MRGRTLGKAIFCAAALAFAGGAVAVVGPAFFFSRPETVGAPAQAGVTATGSLPAHVLRPSRARNDAAQVEATEPCVSQGEGPPAPSGRPRHPVDDPDALARLDSARSRESGGGFKEAEDAYRSLLEENWSNAEAHAGLGRVLSKGGDLHGAEAHLQRAVLLDPGDAQTRLDLAAVEIWLLRYPSARQHLQAVVDAHLDGAHADAARTLLRLVDALDAPDA